MCSSPAICALHTIAHILLHCLPGLLDPGLAFYAVMYITGASLILDSDPECPQEVFDEKRPYLGWGLYLRSLPNLYGTIHRRSDQAFPLRVHGHATHHACVGWESPHKPRLYQVPVQHFTCRKTVASCNTTRDRRTGI